MVTGTPSPIAPTVFPPETESPRISPRIPHTETVAGSPVPAGIAQDNLFFPKGEFDEETLRKFFQQRHAQLLTSAQRFGEDYADVLKMLRNQRDTAQVSQIEAKQERERLNAEWQKKVFDLQAQLERLQPAQSDASQSEPTLAQNIENMLQACKKGEVQSLSEQHTAWIAQKPTVDQRLTAVSGVLEGDVKALVARVKANNEACTARVAMDWVVAACRMAVFRDRMQKLKQEIDDLPPRPPKDRAQALEKELNALASEFTPFEGEIKTFCQGTFAPNYTGHQFLNPTDKEKEASDQHTKWKEANDIAKTNLSKYSDDFEQAKQTLKVKMFDGTSIAAVPQGNWGLLQRTEMVGNFENGITLLSGAASILAAKVAALPGDASEEQRAFWNLQAEALKAEYTHFISQMTASKSAFTPEKSQSSRIQKQQDQFASSWNEAVLHLMGMQWKAKAAEFVRAKAQSVDELFSTTLTDAKDKKFDLLNVAVTGFKTEQRNQANYSPVEIDKRLNQDPKYIPQYKEILLDRYKVLLALEALEAEKAKNAFKEENWKRDSSALLLPTASHQTDAKQKYAAKLKEVSAQFDTQLNAIRERCKKIDEPGANLGLTLDRLNYAFKFGFPAITSVFNNSESIPLVSGLLPASWKYPVPLYKMWFNIANNRLEPEQLKELQGMMPKPASPLGSTALAASSLGSTQLASTDTPAAAAPAASGDQAATTPPATPPAAATADTAAAPSTPMEAEDQQPK